MTNSQRLATVRARLRSWLANHSGDSTSQSETTNDQEDISSGDCSNPILRETILIRDEFYCGRRFYMPSHQAVWFIEEDQLKIYHDGKLVCVLSGAEIDVPDVGQPVEPADVIKLPLPSQSDDHGDEEIRRAA